MIFNNEEYILSKYNVMLQAKNGGSVIYNTLTGAITKIKAEHAERINNVIHGGGETKYSGIDLDEKEVDMFIKQGHIIKSGVDEIALLEITRKKAIESKRSLNIIVLTTLSCNFDCIYCYEEKRKEFMSEETSDRIMKFLEQNIQFYEEIFMFWFGGEPLLWTEPLVRIAEHVNWLAKKYNKKLNHYMTTNGYLIDKNIDMLMRLGILTYQISVDGNELYHNINRPLVGGKATYSKIISNIKLLLKHPNTIISLRINFNSTNYKNIKMLLREFSHDERCRIRVVFEPIFGSKEISATGSMSSEEIAAFMIDNYSYIKAEGYRISVADSQLIAKKSVYCFAEKESQIAFSPNGNLFKCLVTNYHDADSLGHIDGSGNIVYHDCKSLWDAEHEQFHSKCKECVYLPLCMGGCYRMRKKLNTNRECTQANSLKNRVVKMIERETGLTASEDMISEKEDNYLFSKSCSQKVE